MFPPKRADRPQSASCSSAGQKGDGTCTCSYYRNRFLHRNIGATEPPHKSQKSKRFEIRLGGLKGWVGYASSFSASRQGFSSGLDPPKKGGVPPAGWITRNHCWMNHTHTPMVSEMQCAHRCARRALCCSGPVGALIARGSQRGGNNGALWLPLLFVEVGEQVALVQQAQVPAGVGHRGGRHSKKSFVPSRRGIRGEVQTHTPLHAAVDRGPARSGTGRGRPTRCEQFKYKC